MVPATAAARSRHGYRPSVLSATGGNMPTQTQLHSARLPPCAFPRGKVAEGTHDVTAEGTGPEPYGPCQGLVRGQGGFQDVQARVVLPVHLPVARQAHEALAHPVSA